MKKTKLGVTIAGAVLMAAMGVPAASAAGVGPGKIVNNLHKPLGEMSGASRFVVKYRNGSSERVNASAVSRGLDAAVTRAGLNRTVLATARSAARPAATASLLRRMGVQGWSVVKSSRMLDATETANFVRELKADPSVESVEIDRMYHRLADVAPAMVPDDQYYELAQWNFHNPVAGVHAPEAWERSQGEGVVVAVIDTGIAQGNPDLAGNVIPGYDMISDKRISRRDSDARVAGGWDMGDWMEANYCTGWATGGSHPAQASSWHGSHVSGTIAQETNNGIGVAGLAHKAKVMPVRVLGSCGGMGTDIADAIVWAAGGEVPGLPVNTNPAEVINMSLGGMAPAGCPASYQDAIDFAVSQGSIIVVAAGNDNDNAASYTMSACNNVISVGATGITGARAPYSNYGARVDIAAPGGSGNNGDGNEGFIWQLSSWAEKGPETDNWDMAGMAGTSMSSPHVAAAVAMVQSVVETPLSWSAMRDLLRQTATPFPVAIPASTPIGAGILNVDAALAKATEVPCDPEVEECGPTATPLVNKVAVTGLSGTSGSEVLYSFEAQAGAVLSFMTYGGTGDVSMHVRLGQAPTDAAFDAKSTRAGNSETVRFTAPQAGTYFIRLTSPSSYTNVSLVARQ